MKSACVCCTIIMNKFTKEIYNMKIFKKATVLLLLLAICMPMLFSCAKGLGTPVMTLGKTEVTENMLEFWLTRYKAYFVQYYMDGNDSAEFWNEKATGTDKTWNETFTEFIVDNAKTYTAALYLFDDLGLVLPESRIEAVDKEIADLLYGQADNNENQFNQILSTYGVNMDILREIYIIEEKVAFLQDYLYGDDGVEKLSSNAKDEYYKDNYVRFQHIFRYTGSRPVTEKNEDGGYDFVYGNDGYVKYEEMTKEQDEKERNTMKALFEDLKAGSLDFDEILDIYNQDIANEEYPNGYYITQTSTYVQEVIDAVFDMEVDEIRYVESDYGVHIIKRLSLIKGDYAKEENVDFFTDFEDNLITKTFNEKLEPYKKQIEVNEELVKKYCLRDVAANYTY